MQTLHVMPEAHGDWCVVDDDTGSPLSRHGSATSAERAARSLASVANAETILVHDRYHRMRRLFVRETERREFD